MQHSLKILQLATLALLISACGGIVGPTAQEATLQARNNELGTQIADLRQTATVEMDRMMVTVEHSETEVRSVAFQRDALRATVIARGTDAGFVDVTIPQDGAGLPPGIDTGSLLPTPAPGVAAPPVTPPGAVDPNAGGVGALAYGVARDLCLGLEVVLPNGDVLSDLNILKMDNTGSNPIKDLKLLLELRSNYARKRRYHPSLHHQA